MVIGGSITIAVFRIIEGVKTLVKKGFQSLDEAKTFVTERFAGEKCVFFRVDDYGIVGSV